MSAWLRVCAVPALASAVLWCAAQTGPGAAAWVQGLAWQAASWPRQPWTLWTAPLVHLSGLHLLTNEAALLALAAIGWSLQAGRATAVAALLAWPASTLSLLLWPTLASYAGLSGFNHALASVLIGLYAMNSRAFAGSATLLAVLVLKLLAEQAWLQPVLPSASWGFGVVVAAHLGGALAGLGCGLLVFAVARPGFPARWRR